MKNHNGHTKVQEKPNRFIKLHKSTKKVLTSIKDRVQQMLTTIARWLGIEKLKAVAKASWQVYVKYGLPILFGLILISYIVLISVTTLKINQMAPEYLMATMRG